jgi:hypothetical protein
MKSHLDLALESRNNILNRNFLNMHRYSSLDEIQKAVENGTTVYWSSQAYLVIKDKIGQWLVEHQGNRSCWGLTNMKGEISDIPEKFFSFNNSTLEDCKDIDMSDDAFTKGQKQ